MKLGSKTIDAAFVGRWFGCDEVKFLGDVYPEAGRLNNSAFGRYFRLNVSLSIYQSL